MVDLRTFYDVSGLSGVDLSDNSNWVAIIGSREASDDEKETAYRIGKEMCQGRSKFVVSGAAKGIDRAGHEGCIGRWRITIAIVNTPIIYADLSKKRTKI